MSNYIAPKSMLPPAQADLSGDATLHMSRRSLLAGSAGLAAAAIGMAAQPAAAQSHDHGHDGCCGAQWQPPPLRRQ